MITNCNCAQRIDCGCTVSFDTYGNNLYSVLSVGNLVGNGCTLEDYVIDWYCDGVHAMVSSKTIKPQIDAYHPFTGSAAIPVKAGSWVPVLRYVVIGGEKIFPTPRNCQKWCSDLQGNLPIITVLLIGCDVVSGSPAAGYTFRISYTTTQDYSYATRTIRWELPADGSAKYLALQFTTYYVFDRVQVFYNDEPTAIRDIMVGYERWGTQVGSIPNFLDQQSCKLVANFSDRQYQPGDYLTIKVTPNTNPNTQWVLDMKCLTADAFECDLFPLSLRDFDFQNAGMTYDSVNCKYLLTFKMNVIDSRYANSNVKSYLGIGAWASSGDSNFNESTGLVTLTLWDKVTCNAWALHTHYQQDSAGLISYAKVGNVFTFTFEHVDDYNAFKAWYLGNRSNWKFSSYTDVVTDVNHYKIHQISWREVATRCGDVFTFRQIYFHWLSPVTFNDTAKTMAIEFYNITNQYPDQQPRLYCSNTYEVINTWVNACQGTINASDWSGSTRCREQRPCNGIWIWEQALHEVSKNLWWGYYIYLKYLENVCNMPGWSEFESLSWAYFFMRFNLLVEITNESDWVNNFRISTILNRETGANNAEFERIYEKQNGIQIFP